MSEWRRVAPLWEQLNADVQGNPAFSALTIKNAYNIGVIYGICQSVTWLLKAPNHDLTFIPAYGTFASGIELLGRCVNGNDTERNNVQDIKIGFEYLVSSMPAAVPNNHILIRTSNKQYTIDELTSLRHFAAHGQATAQFVVFDKEILAAMPPLLADGLERYWNDLQQDAALCNNLAKAKVLAFRNVPVYISWSLFERDEHGVYHSINTIFNRFDWHV